MHSNSNGRASLLSGLRTGGVRSASQPSIVPHTAAVGGSFNVSRHSPYNHQQSHFPEEEADELVDMMNYGMNLNGGGGNHRMMPATAGPLDGGAAGNRFQQQQQAAFLQQMAAQRSMNGMGIPGMTGVDPMQMQLMQLELMKLQALQQAQQQQFQVELMAQQSQRQQMMQQQQQRNPRRSSTYGEPATAGPGQTSFDLRGPNQFARDQGDAYGLDQGGPKTAALGGKFGGRPVLSALNPNATVFTLNPEEPSTPKTATPGNAGRTTVISGGTSLGGGAGSSSGSSSGTGTPAVLSNVNTTPATPSKSDSAASWRRPSGMAGTGTPLTPTRTSAPSLSPLVRLPPGSDDSNTPSPLRQRPSPLRFNDPSNGAAYGEFEASSESDLDSYVSGGRRAASSSSVSDNERDSAPTTPPSAESVGSLTREEASKRLYEGLGVGRTIQIQVPTMHAPPKQATQVIRQPRGPPASVDELGPRNFAARLQKRLVAQAA